MIRFFSYYILLVAICIAGGAQWNKVSRADKWMIVLAAITAINEPITYWAKIRYHNNLLFYNCYTPFEFLCYCMYFNNSLPLLKKYGIGVYVGILGFVLAVINTLAFQPIHTVNSYFLLFEGTVIIIFCLISFYRMFLKAVEVPYRQAHFWFVLCMLLFWSTAFTGFGLWAILNEKDRPINRIFDAIILMDTYLLYGGMSIIFIRYKKLVPSGE